MSKTGFEMPAQDAARGYILDMVEQLTRLAEREGLRELESLLTLTYTATSREAARWP